ncbi:MAG: DNA polymerase I [Myxococcales bacterium]|nr:DNA polymerase I [Myxococcales bacterium]MBK7194430.1 DNA polymerase I [Myxococcales bacterium]
MERLHVVDGHGYIFRAHFGLMNASSRSERKEVRLSTREGMPTGALYVFARMLLRLHDDVGPERIAVVFDAGRKSFRTEIFPEYKANRPPAPEDLAIQMPRFAPLVEALGWPVLAIPGVEADDVVATLASAAAARGWECTIYSADKDLMQLVGEHTAVIDAMRAQTYTRAAVIEKFGVPPERIADFLALRGDTSDNIPGVAGVGDKTAAELVNTFPDLEALIAANPKVRGKHPLGDPAQVERLRISRRLVELDRQVALPTAVEDLRARSWDRPALTAIFQELEFANLVEKVERTVAARADAVPPPVATIEAPAALGPAPAVADTAAAIADVCAAARAAGRVALAVETTGRFDRATVIGVALAVAGHAPAYVPLAHRSLAAGPPPSDAALAPLAALLADATIGKVIHDSKHAERCLGHRGWPVVGIVDDPMLAQFLIDASAEPSVATLAAGVGATLPEHAAAVGKAGSFEAAAPAEAAAWLGVAAAATGAAAPRLRAQLEGRKVIALYDDLELPIARILCELERTGICIDRAHFEQLSAEVAAQIAGLEARIAELGGGDVNVGSPKQLAALLFERLGLESDRMKKTKTGYSVDHEVLESLIDAHPIVRPILDHRELTKLRGTYLDALPPLVHPKTGRLHTLFNQVVAATGRISSQDPNLQNIPIRTEVGRAIRKGFVAAPGKVLLAADYSQIELRIMAHLSGDPVLCKAFREGIDVHAQTASEVLELPLTAITAKERRIAKAVNYGLIYGQSDFGLARALDISKKDAREYIDRYFARLPTVRRFMDQLVADAKAAGGARTVLGRWRPIPELASKSPVARRAAERVAQNTPLQGSGADILKRAMVACHARIARERLPATMLLTVHDELVFEIDPERADAIGAAIKQEMEQAFALDVPLEVDLGVARSWADA